MKPFDIPENASKVTITSNIAIAGFSSIRGNPAIVSIEHFESNSINSLWVAFNDFTNITEFKHFDVKSKVINAYGMCSGWINFNGTIPEGFCSIFENLENASGMFSNWKKFNQPLPEGFCTNIENLKTSFCMFNNWETFNQPLPEGFFGNIKNLILGAATFRNWKSFNQPLVKEFFSNIEKLKVSDEKYASDSNENVFSADCMFENWNSYEHVLPQYLINNFNEFRNHTNFCTGWNKSVQLSA